MEDSELLNSVPLHGVNVNLYKETTGTLPERVHDITVYILLHPFLSRKNRLNNGVTDGKAELIYNTIRSGVWGVVSFRTNV